MGGSFDPIHNAHLAMGKWALRKDHCKEVWYIPTVSTPLKDRALTSYAIRAAMVKAAVAPYRHMKLCTIEEKLAAPSYTVRTLRALKKRYPKAEFVWYIGADQAAQLDKWKNIEECLQLAAFKIFRRNGELINCAYDLPILDMEEMPVSSTQIRQGAFQHCPASVRSIIAQERLYIDEYAAHSMSEKRYRHSVSVAALSAIWLKPMVLTPRLLIQRGCFMISASNGLMKKHGFGCRRSFLNIWMKHRPFGMVI